MTIERLVAACEELRVDALHNVSLGSKELFHSNFLAWFAQGYPQSAAEVFAEWVDPGDPGPGPTAERERAHLDLVLRLPGLRLIVVENKVWSLPDDSQLARYGAGPVKKLANELAKEGGPAPILLSLSPPAWDGPARMLGGVTWVYVPYPGLARGLERAAARLPRAGNSEARFSGELLHRYAVLVERLCRVAGEVSPVSPAEPVWLDDHSHAALTKARVYDGMSKLRGHRALSFVLDRLSSASPAPEILAPAEGKAVGFTQGTSLQFLRLGRRVAALEVNFTNSMPALAGMVAVDNGDKLFDKLFWQYQGQDWRLTVATARYQGRDEASRALREAYVAERYGGWFNFDPVKDLLGPDRGTPVPVKGGGQFNRFNPDSAYRYARVDQGGHLLTVSELADLGACYLHRAASWPEER